MEQNQTTPSIGHLMKAARKFKKYNQLDVAKAIGCSQSALSKMEHNLLTPSAPQWFLFSRFTAIPPESIETGFIHRNSEVVLNNEQVSLGYRLPKRYRQNRALKVREIYPLMVYIKKKFGLDSLLLFFKEAGLDNEFFLDFDNLISYQLMVDLVNYLGKQGHSHPVQIKELVDLGQNEIYWKSFFECTASGHQNILETFSEKQALFQKDFTVKLNLEASNPHVVYSPESHVYQFLKDLTDSTRVWLAYYRKFTIESMLEKNTGQKFEAKYLGEVNSPLSHHFELVANS